MITTILKRRSSDTISTGSRFGKKKQHHEGKKEGEKDAAIVEAPSTPETAEVTDPHPDNDKVGSGPHNEADGESKETADGEAAAKPAEEEKKVKETAFGRLMRSFSFLTKRPPKKKASESDDAKHDVSKDDAKNEVIKNDVIKNDVNKDDVTDPEADKASEEKESKEKRVSAQSTEDLKRSVNGEEIKADTKFNPETPDIQQPEVLTIEIKA